MKAIETAREALLAQLAPIDTEANQLQARLDELNEGRNRLKAALKALDTTRKPKAKANGKAAKPSPKQKNVREVALALVTENPGLTKAELEELTKHKLTEDLGFDLKGFEMRWNEVLAADTFTIDGNNIVTMPKNTNNKAVATSSVVDSQLRESAVES